MTSVRTRAAALLLAVAGAFAAPSAFATEPSDAQVDRLIEVMDMRRVLDEMFVQVDTMATQMGERMLGEDATPAQRTVMGDAMKQQNASLRRLMSWENMGPIYRRIYRRLFTADEVDAMIAFYGSETGRGIMRKMPQAMELGMQEMQPLLQAHLAQMQKELEAAKQDAEASPKKD
ncbi:DUF2059 domain-containing protein [Lysobacter brunescens]|uniref:DUF2059 domain-containing protein n=1 Tax=Lysobacter brunescens TaxID=262323 RepID=A0ABW2YAY5_9GAMM